MDTALKHRLTGAVILVLLAVLLLPELLTGSGQAGRNRISAKADAEGEERSIRIDLTEAAMAPATTTPAPVPAPAPAPEANPAPAAVALPMPAEQAPPADQAESAVAAPTVAAPTAAAPTAAAPAVAAPPSAAAPAPTNAALSAEAFFVQLGVFENRASARNLERKLREKNFMPVIDEIERSGTTLHRVRVGPEPDRAAANALRTRLAAAGHKGSVVK